MTAISVLFVCMGGEKAVEGEGGREREFCRREMLSCPVLAVAAV